MKQTEIGLIPDDWEVKTLGDLFEMKAGGDVDKQHFSSYRSDKYKYKIFSNGLENEGIYGYTDLPKYKGDSITITGRGTVGVSMYRKDDFDAVIRLLVLNSKNRNTTDNYYISEVINEIVKFPNESTGVPQLTVPQIKDVFIPLPPLPEQQRIAKALSDVDALISTTEKLLQKNIKQGTMQNFLTEKKRLPGFGSQTKSPTCKQTELGPIPEDWEVKSFDELFDICTETISVDSIKKESYIGTENMLQDKMGVIKNETELNYLKVREYRKQDILVSNIRPYLKKIWFADKNGGCSTDVLVFRKKRNSDNADFLLKIVSDDRFFNIVNDNAVGTKMPRGDKNIIKHVLFAIPTTKEEQTAIANVLSSMDKEIETLNTKLEKYRNLKTAMMQQLLTGKIRLVE